MWNRAVTIRVNGNSSNQKWNIRSTSEAAQCLLGRWPGPKDEKFKHAVVGCKKALRGEISHQLARLSFQSAAQSAQILIGVTKDIGEADDMVAELTEMAAQLYADHLNSAVI